ncbi:hypothetical protein OSB04_003777 [Centaurea solstitialis]|uniref:Uncharacterized protein n=1 Tax=Centaurea solstitialis TaxID=347529 RepID=A0AA38U813_9ASTR|nr:hypothetical protein OSB04_003777 [Centaurea solstitialis]
MVKPSKAKGEGKPKGKGVDKGKRITVDDGEKRDWSQTVGGFMKDARTGLRPSVASQQEQEVKGADGSQTVASQQQVQGAEGVTKKVRKQRVKG